MTLSDLALIPAPLDGGALYDRFGNRYLFASHREYAHARRAQIISWLTKRTPLCFL